MTALNHKSISAVGNDPLIKALRYCFMLVGLREANFPTTEETAVLVHYIRKYYSNHTTAEIQLAFEMAIDGRDFKVDTRSFENFSVQFFSSIMNAYRDWAKDKVKALPLPVAKSLTQRIDECFYKLLVKDKLPCKTIR